MPLNFKDNAEHDNNEQAGCADMGAVYGHHDWVEAEITFAQLEKNSRDFFRNNPGCKVQTSENMIASKTMGMHKDVTEEFANKAYPLVLQKVVGRFSSF